MISMSEKNTRLAYSTENTIPRKDRPAEKDLPYYGHLNDRDKVRVRLDRKGRAGKSVTVIEGLMMRQREKEAMLKQLKADIGTGGTLKDGDLELQGDHCRRVMEALNKLGYRPKRSGG